MKIVILYLVSFLLLITLNRFDLISNNVFTLGGIAHILLFWPYIIYHFEVVPRKFKKLGLILFEELDPQKFIEKLNEFMNARKMTSRNRIMCGFGLAAGYIENGEVSQALELYTKLSKSRVSRKITYYGHYGISLCYFAQGDLEQGLKYYQLFKSVKYKRNSIEHRHYILKFEAIIAYHQGRYEESLSKQYRVLNEAKSEYRKVLSHFDLAQTYKALGDIQKHKEHLYYVVENGNKLHVTKRAKKMLEQLQKG